MIEVFTTCLFDLHNFSSSLKDYTQASLLDSTQKYVKCKSSKSRKISYKIINTIVSYSLENLILLLKNGLFKLLQEIPESMK